MNSKRFLLIALIAFSGVFLAGCTLWGEDTSKTEEPSKINIVNDEPANEADEAQDTETDSTDEGSDSGSTGQVDDDSEDSSTSDEESSSDDSDVDEGTEDSSFSSMTSYDGATKSDSIRILKYSYEVSGGKMLFTWEFAGGTSALKVASYEAGYDSDGYLNVVFPSLSKDYIATTETTTKLGSALPELTWKPDGDGSIYLFKTAKQSAYTLRADGNMLTLSWSL